MNNHTIAGVDLAKDVIQVCLVKRNKVQSNDEMSSSDFSIWLATSKPLQVVFEACGSSNYWKRFAIEHGHDAKLIYGEKWRYGETITTAFVESTVNEVVSKRMVKKQQMQWSHPGANWLLQTRTAVLNGELRDHFEQWYPEMKLGTDDGESNTPVRMAA